MGRMGKVVDKAFTPHQCAYGDRKNPYWEKSPNNKNMGEKVIILWVTVETCENVSLGDNFMMTMFRFTALSDK